MSSGDNNATLQHFSTTGHRQNVLPASFSSSSWLKTSEKMQLSSSTTETDGVLIYSPAENSHNYLSASPLPLASGSGSGDDHLVPLFESGGQEIYMGPTCRIRRKIGAAFHEYNVPETTFINFTCRQCARHLRLEADNITEDPVPENATSLQNACNEMFLADIDCERWKKCCDSAVTCCKGMIKTQSKNVTETTLTSVKYCPEVWDGIGCIPKTLAGVVTPVDCPRFIYPNFDPGPFEAYGNKTCNPDGEWAMYEERGGESTAYQPCAAGAVEWVRVGCEAITVLVRLFMMTSYSAMSVEAFYLHWNVACAFRQLTRLRVLFAIGWTFPLLVIGIYIPLRITYANPEIVEHSGECWISPWRDFGFDFEFIIYGVNFACLAINIIFLISLFFITCRLQSVHRRRGQPCELLKRREFRAMITFTFLFGVPQILVLIRINGLSGFWFKTYEIVSTGFITLQGTFASILLCYLNTEVRTVFLRTALGIVLARERARYESIMSNLSSRVRNSMASFERRRSGRRSKTGATSGRTSGDSMSGIEGAPMLRSPSESSERPMSVTYISNNNNNSNNHHNYHQHHHKPRNSQFSLSPVPGSEPTSPTNLDSSVSKTPNGYFFVNGVNNEPEDTSRPSGATTNSADFLNSVGTTDDTYNNSIDLGNDQPVEIETCIADGLSTEPNDNNNNNVIIDRTNDDGNDGTAE